MGVARHRAVLVECAAALARRLGDRVGHWITLNEPRVVVTDGYIKGQKAPGVRDPALTLPVAHHLLLAHGAATQALRAELPADAAVGITVDFAAIEAATDRERDVEAARVLDGLRHRLYLDPLYRGVYPEDALALLATPPDLDARGRPRRDRDANRFSRRQLFTRRIAHAGPDGPTIHASRRAWRADGDRLGGLPTGADRDTAATARCRLRPAAAVHHGERRGVPGRRLEDGHIHDGRRIDYLRDHMRAAREAIAEGIPLHGYFAWSLMDNFEWSHGYSPRFGVVYTDYATGAHPKGQRAVPRVGGGDQWRGARWVGVAVG